MSTVTVLRSKTHTHTHTHTHRLTPASPTHTDPFHNVFNPVIAALFAGNAIVIKASEYASWSTKYYGAIIHACLRAVGAPEDLVQVTMPRLQPCEYCYCPLSL